MTTEAFLDAGRDDATTLSGHGYRMTNFFAGPWVAHGFRNSFRLDFSMSTEDSIQKARYQCCPTGEIVGSTECPYPKKMAGHRSTAYTEQADVDVDRPTLLHTLQFRFNSQ
jgi:hypothetical protein